MPKQPSLTPSIRELVQEQQKQSSSGQSSIAHHEPRFCCSWPCMTLAAALLAIAASTYIARTRAELDGWYLARLRAQGFGGRPTFLEVSPSVGGGVSAAAHEADARHVVEQAEFQQFIAMSKVPNDPRWVFAAAGKHSCPPLTNYNYRLSACVFARKPAQSLWSFLQGGVHGRQESLYVLLVLLVLLVLTLLPQVPPGLALLVLPHGLLRARPRRQEVPARQPLGGVHPVAGRQRALGGGGQAAVL